MDLSKNEIEEVFKRQVYLCSGLGFERMQTILKDHFERRRQAEEYLNKHQEKLPFSGNQS